MANEGACPTCGAAGKLVIAGNSLTSGFTGISSGRDSLGRAISTSFFAGSLGGDDGSGRGKSIRLGGWRATFTSSGGLGAGLTGLTSSFGAGGTGGGAGGEAGNLGSSARRGGVGLGSDFGLGLVGEGSRARFAPGRGSSFFRVSFFTFRDASDNAACFSGLTCFSGLGSGRTSTKRGRFRRSLGGGR